MLTSYHNHTTWSDGKTSLAAMIHGARAAGLDELGISDHYVVAPSGLDVKWTMPLERVGEYVAELQEAAGTAGVTLRVGIEADFFPETVGDLRDRLAQFPFDYVIGSVHYVEGFPLDETAALWEALSEEERNEMWRGYWERIRQMAAS